MRPVDVSDPEFEPLDRREWWPLVALLAACAAGEVWFLIWLFGH